MKRVKDDLRRRQAQAKTYLDLGCKGAFAIIKLGWCSNFASNSASARLAETWNQTTS
ncbi:hypothetical protein Plhal304r1_c086g0169481 [Plasmopara halstedii]